jgi:glycine/D-amino acid oxidase-like deaminating enzyme
LWRIYAHDRYVYSDPEQFCHTLHAALSKDKRFRTLFGEAKSISGSAQVGKSLHCVMTGSGSKESITFTELIIAAGPWSAVVCKQLRLPPIALTNLPGHSLLIRPALSAVGLNKDTDELPSGAVFAGIGEDAHMGVEAATGGTGRHLNEAELALGYTDAPELFPRWA